jgi:hypothetical protein
MGEYLLLSWLSTRRGLAVFILLVLMTAFANLYRLASNRGSVNQPVVEAGNNLGKNQGITSQSHRNGDRVNKDQHPRKPVKSVQPR